MAPDEMVHFFSFLPSHIDFLPSIADIDSREAHIRCFRKTCWLVDPGA